MAAAKVRFITSLPGMVCQVIVPQLQCRGLINTSLASYFFYSMQDKLAAASDGLAILSVILEF
jgi:hypothetical protein